MNPYLRIFAIVLLLGTSSCTHPTLNVFSTYVTRESLASYYVGTPDPLLNAPNVGQKLYIRWHLPSSYLALQPLQLKLHMRFHNRKFDILVIPITRLCGIYVYELLNKEFFDTEGLMSYKVEVIANDQVLEEWRHIMWVEPITFEEEEEKD